MDIGSGHAYPSSALSNFAPHEFMLDGVKIASAEGFLQSLKFSNPDMQVHICSLVGMGAKRAGVKKNWKTDQTLYWRDKAIKRDSTEYQELLDRAYTELAKNEGFKKALLASQQATLTHSVGKTKINDTVLTVREFCGRLTRIRKELQEIERLTKSGFKNGY